MLQPDVGVLLDGLRTALSGSVLPSVADPAAQRQLKAGLHLLARLRRTWDLSASIVRSDNLDMEAVLETEGKRIRAAGVDCPTWAWAPPLAAKVKTGINDPALAEDLARNVSLRHAIEALAQSVRMERSASARSAAEQLFALYQRMARRESILTGDLNPDAPETNAMSDTQ